MAPSYEPLRPDAELGAEIPESGDFDSDPQSEEESQGPQGRSWRNRKTLGMYLGLFCVIAGVGWLQSGTQGGTATVSSKSLEKVEELFSEEHVYVIESAGAPGRFLTVNAEDLTILGGDP